MSLALEEEMWSKAADEATGLMAVAAGSTSLMEYAVVGLCQSDFDEEKTTVRKYVPAGRFGEICGVTPREPTTAAASAVASPAGPAAEPVTVNAAAKSRLGIAILIGNSEYWNQPLNSVKSDLKGMADTLRSLGFAVTVKENLRSPRHFLDALDETLKKESATPEDVLLVYYSGHGLQLDGKAHLLSTNVSASARVAEDLRDNAQSAEDLLAQMERSIPSTRILIIEACRDNVLAAGTAGVRAARGGFAFQQDDVANTFVMFANKPGLTTPVRSEYGLMGPFTEGLVYALQNSTGDILDVYNVAAKKVAEMSPGQEPVLYHSKSIDPIVLRRESQNVQDKRAKELLNGAEMLYRARAWEEFRATVVRGRALAAAGPLQGRFAREAEFADLVTTAEAAEKRLKWADAAASWQKAGELFVLREWVFMKAGIAWLLADDLSKAVRVLAVLAVHSESEMALQAKRMLTEFIKTFPELAEDSDKAAREAAKPPAGAEFERIQLEE